MAPSDKSKMEVDLDRLKSKRSALRGGVTRTITKINDILKEIELSSKHVEDLNELLEILLDKHVNIKELDEKIVALIIDRNEYEKEFSICEEYTENVISYRCRILNRIKKFDVKNGLNATAVNSETPFLNGVNNDVHNVCVKLPKLVLEKFSGDPSKWHEFYNAFENSIGQNTSLTKVEKLAYLKSLLIGPAFNCVAGFSFTSENYDSCIELLKNRFGRKDLIINSHMNKLLSLEPVRYSNNVQGLRKLYDQLEICIRNLNSVNVTSGSYGHLLNPIILKLLPQDLNLEFHRKRTSKENFEITELIEFIKNETECREAALSVVNSFNEKRIPFESQKTNAYEKQKFHFGKNVLSAATVNTSLSSFAKPFCIFCKTNNHDSVTCEAVPDNLKRLQLKRENRCYRCYKKNHHTFECRARIGKCNLCHTESHVALFCPLKKNRNESSVRGETVVSLSQAKANPGVNGTLLQTFTVLISENKKCEIVRCLADSGSERTFITREIAEALKLVPIKRETLLVYCFGQRKPKEITYNVVSVKLNSLIGSDSLEVQALVTDVITASKVKQIPPEVLDIVSSWGYEVCNPLDSSKQINVLLGSDYSWKILRGEVKKIREDLFLTDTIFGPTVQGQTNCFALPVHEGCGVSCSLATPSCVMSVSVDVEEKSLNEQIKRFWCLESLGIVNEDGNEMESDITVIQEFENNLCFRNGRYEVKLLWNTDKVFLKNNYEIAKNRFLKLINKLNRNHWVFENYNSIIKEQIESGIVEICTDKGPRLNSYFMPHRPVIRDDRSTTKVRVVYDASSKQPDANSLNDCLFSGPNLNPNILNVILKFRENKIAFCADIEKAFLQIGIAEEDRNYLRFLYFKDCDRNKEVTSYRFTRAPFGVTCSPFILASTIKYHIRQYEKTHFEVFNMLNTSLYVDDLFFGSETVEKAFSLSTEGARILREANMNLRKFGTNSSELRGKWQECGFLELKNDLNENLKVLGMAWETGEDCLKLELQPLLLSLKSLQNTKRSVLQTAAKCFDPAGFISPFIIRIKCLMQELWELGLEWDEIFDKKIEERWSEWYSEIEYLEGFLIPRYYFMHSEEVVPGSVQIHIFADASLRAYGAVAYFRYITTKNNIKTSFIMSKSRVSPLKKLTLPRLELMGALTAARVGNCLSKLFSARKIIYWTDSTITLYWIKGSALRWKQFVSNRVVEIQDLTNPQDWRHCDGKNNPADLVSRGCSAKSLSSNKLWLEGPVWLIRDENFWPKIYLKEGEIDVTTERRNVRKVIPMNLINIDQRFDILFRFSSWTKLRRVIAWCLRFISNVKTTIDKRKGFLTAEELNRSAEIIVKCIQQDEFSEEIRCLKAGKPISSHSKIISLNPFLDKMNIMRVGGRLGNANISENQKYPIILPKNNVITTLIIKSYHETYLHAGPQLMLSLLRQKFWILSARTAIKKVLNRCIVCCRFRAKGTTQLMADLPSSRVLPTRPFTHVGIDFAGPFSIKSRPGRGVKTIKCYVSIFICFSTRAIHMELAGDLSSQCFLGALRRFVARRGRPSEIFSDCGTNFVGASKELRRIVISLKNSAQLHGYFSTEAIKWLFNPPSAPHFGGLWEAGVKSMKYHLRRTVGAQVLTYEEFLTVISQIEACLNSRPLTQVSSDPCDITALTPGHFLIGAPLTAVPDVDLIDQKVPLQKRWQLTLQMVQGFWKRWSREYLCQLQQRGKWRHSNQNIQVNDLVLLREDHLPPLCWRLGRVTEVFPGADTKVRVVKVKTSHGELKRPVTKLCPLPVYDE